jgi:integrase
MRREEVTGIAVSELDLPEDGQGVFTLPANRSKNDRAIRVPLSPLARSVVDRALAARPIIESTGKPSPLLISTTGTTPASGWSKAKARLDGYIMEAREARAAESGEEAEAIQPWRLHDLRRAFATAACDILHIDPAVADRCLNHVGASTTSTISRVYGRSEMFDQRRAALTAWGALLERELRAEAATNVVPIGSAARG